MEARDVAIYMLIISEMFSDVAKYYAERTTVRVINLLMGELTDTQEINVRCPF